MSEISVTVSPTGQIDQNENTVFGQVDAFMSEAGIDIPDDQKTDWATIVTVTTQFEGVMEEAASSVGHVVTEYHKRGCPGGTDESVAELTRLVQTISQDFKRLRNHNQQLRAQIQGRTGLVNGLEENAKAMELYSNAMILFEYFEKNVVPLHDQIVEMTAR
jgi:archaellum component FlaC